MSLLSLSLSLSAMVAYTLPRIVDECRNDEFRDSVGSMIDER
jgi:hypothetical protein